jgi:predicted transcriptional regulator
MAPPRNEVQPPIPGWTCLAKATGRPKSWLINDALSSFVANERQFLAAVEKGKKALRVGRVVDHATVIAAFERLVAPRQ